MKGKKINYKEGVKLFKVLRRKNVIPYSWKGTILSQKLKKKEEDYSVFLKGNKITSKSWKGGRLLKVDKEPILSLIFEREQGY